MSPKLICRSPAPMWLHLGVRHSEEEIKVKQGHRAGALILQGWCPYKKSHLSFSPHLPPSTP